MTKKIIKEKIEKAGAVCIFTHINADADAVGSAMAMREVLTGMGKRADIYMEEPAQDTLRFMGDGYTVYENMPPVKYDLAIALDCAGKDRLGKRAQLFDSAADSVCIDHHGTNKGYAAVNYIEADAAATGQILYYLFTEWGFDICTEAAGYLYAAISADSGSFKYKSASRRTFEAAGALVDMGIDHARISKELFDTCSENELRLRGYLMSCVRCCADGKIAVISTDEALLERFGVKDSEAHDLVNIPRMISGVRIAVELKRRGGQTRVSLRSDGVADVSGLAVALGGGGHRAAAGATLDIDDLEKAEAFITEECKKLL